MKTTLIITMLGSLALLAQTPRPPTPRSEADNGSVSGQVLDADTGTPVSDLSITAIEAGTGEGAKTDAQGRYTIAGVSSGVHQIVVRGQRVWPDLASASVTVTAGKNTVGVDLRVWRDGTISGRVVDGNKDPVAGITVHLIGREYYAGGLHYFSDGGGLTDDRGNYSFRNVRSNRTIFVVAEMRKTYDSPISDTPADISRRRPAYRATFYPASDSVQGATPITLGSDEQRDNVQIQVLRSPSYCVEATLLADGRPSSMNFRVTDEGTGSSNLTPGSGSSGPPGVASGPDGKIRLCDFPPGQFRIAAFRRSTNGIGSAGYFGTALVKIDKADIDQIIVRTSDASSIQGEVAWDGAPPEQSTQAQFAFGLQSVTNDALPGPSARSPIPGQFTFTALQSVAYTFRMSLTPVSSVPNAYLKDVRFGDVSVFHHTLMAVPDASLRVIYGSDGGFIKATVTGKDGQAVTGAHVLLLPANVPSEAILADAMISGQTDAAGAYSSIALAPGKYFALATSETTDNTPEHISRVWQARKRGREIDVAPNATVQTSLELKSLD